MNERCCEVCEQAEGELNQVAGVPAILVPRRCAWGNYVTCTACLWPAALLERSDSAGWLLNVLAAHYRQHGWGTIVLHGPEPTTETGVPIVADAATDAPCD